MDRRRWLFDPDASLTAADDDIHPGFHPCR